MQETTPLLSKDKVPKSKGSGVSFSIQATGPPNAPKGLVLEEPSTLSRMVGKVLQDTEWMSNYVRNGFNVLLLNTLAICIILLYAKSSGNEFFLNWSSQFAGLGNWNLQMANVLLVLTYSLSNFLVLRLCLCCGSMMFMIYGLTSPLGYMLDMIFFNFAMMLLNFRHAIVLLYEKRYIEFPREQEQVYRAVFAEFMRRTEFNELLEGALVRREKAGVVLKQRGDFVTSLVVLVSGKVVVSNKTGVPINIYMGNEFLEAPEWVKASLNPEGQRFRVTFTTDTDIVYIKWPLETLVSLFKRNAHALSSLRSILGIQTARLWLRSIEIKDEGERRQAAADSPEAGPAELDSKSSSPPSPLRSPRSVEAKRALFGSS